MIWFDSILDSQIEKTRLIQFLMGLRSSYTAARGHLLMMNPWPIVNHAYMLIKQEGKQRQIAGTSTPIAMMINIPNSKHATSFSNNQRTFDKSSESGNSKTVTSRLFGI